MIPIADTRGVGYKCTKHAYNTHSVPSSLLCSCSSNVINLQREVQVRALCADGCDVMKVSATNADRRDVERMYNRHTIHQLQQLAPFVSSCFNVKQPSSASEL